MFNFFKGFFGPSDPNERPRNFNSREDFLREKDDTFSSGNSFNDQNDQMGFNVFTNPVEMHRYFEAQLNSMLKSFGIPNGDIVFGFNEDSSDSFSNFLEGPEEHKLPSTNGDLRDQFLKPGYQQPNPGSHERSDSDLDGKIDLSEIDSMFSDEKRQLQPLYEPKPKLHNFGRQIVTKSFTNNNGIIQSQQTVRDHDGNEETIVTHKRGDQEYTRVTRIDKNGHEEIKESLVNMSEEDLSKFFGDQKDSPLSILDKKPPNWFPFDKYFK